MEALFARDTGNLFSSGSSNPKSFYCPTTPHRRSHNTRHVDPVLKVSGPPLQPSPSDIHWDLNTPQQQLASGSQTTYSPSDSPNFNESWPSCSEQTPPAQAPPTSVPERTPLAESVMFDGSVEASSRPSLASLVERFRTAPPTRREERDFLWKKEKLHPFSVTESLSPNSDTSTSTPQSSGKSQSVEVSPQVSDNSLESRSRDLIGRGSSLVSSPSSQATSLTVKNYFNSRNQSDGDIEEVWPGGKTREVVNAGREVHGCGSVCPEEDVLYQWRLRRRLEEARREAIFISEQAKQFHHPTAAHNKLSLSTQSHLPTAGRGGRTGLTGIETRSDGMEKVETGLTGVVSGLSGIAGTELTDRDLPHACTCTCTWNCHGNTFQADVVDSHGAGETNIPPGCGEVDQPVSMELGEAKLPSPPLGDTGARLSAESEAGKEQATASVHNTAPPDKEDVSNVSKSIPSSSEPMTAVSQCATPPPSGPRAELPAAVTIPHPSGTRAELSAAVTTPPPSGPEEVTKRSSPCGHCVPALSLSLDDKDVSEGEVSVIAVECGDTSHWTITPCGSPDAGLTHSIGPILNEVIGHRLFQHRSTPPPRSSPTPLSQTTESGSIDAALGCPDLVSSVVGSHDHSWEDDMNDDLLKLLIEKARCFEAGIRRIDQLLAELDDTDQS